MEGHYTGIEFSVPGLLITMPGILGGPQLTSGKGDVEKKVRIRNN